MKKRYSVTLSDSFQKGLKELVDRGFYIDAQTAIRESLRNTFEKHGVDPFNYNNP